MEVSEVKENLGKDVLFRLSDSKTESEFTLNAYIFRIDPRNPQRRLSQLELQDKNCSHSVVIVGIENVRPKEKSRHTNACEPKKGMPEKFKLKLEKLKENLKDEVQEL